MQQKPRPVRVDQEYDEMVKAMMTDRLWSYNKAINFIVREFFKGGEVKEEKKEVAVKKSKAPAKRFVKPIWEELASYFHEQGSMTCQDDATKFLDYYESNGWKVGKNSMKSWKATVRQWVKRSKDNEQQNRSKAISGRDAITFKDNDF